MTALLYGVVAHAQSYEPRGRYYPEDGDMPLPELGFTGTALVLAAVLFGVGMLISKMSKDGQSLFGGILIGLGFLCALPGLMWIQAIAASIYVVGFVVLFVGAGLMWVFGKFK